MLWTAPSPTGSRTTTGRRPGPGRSKVSCRRSSPILGFRRCSVSRDTKGIRAAPCRVGSSETGCTRATLQRVDFAVCGNGSSSTRNTSEHFGLLMRTQCKPETEFQAKKNLNASICIKETSSFFSAGTSCSILTFFTTIRHVGTQYNTICSYFGVFMHFCHSSQLYHVESNGVMHKRSQGACNL